MTSNPYKAMVDVLCSVQTSARRYPTGGMPPCPAPQLPDDAPVALLFSPHPDDECITGLLPLRLLRQAGVRIVNVAVTQGSLVERRAARYAELQGACEFLGFELIQIGDDGLAKINLKTRETDAEGWREAVEVIAEILVDNRPRVIFLPHANDWNSTHIGTHWLVMDALATLAPDFSAWIVETEFWGALESPNLLVEASPAELADLMAATSFHVGEVRRNPYHLGLPAWMQDNVRRGAELVGGQGGEAPNFMYGTLYRLRFWQQGELYEVTPGQNILPAAAEPTAIFEG